MHEREALVGRPWCRWEALVKKVTDIQVLENAGNFFGCYELDSCGLVWVGAGSFLLAVTQRGVWGPPGQYCGLFG
jgi:hypothetical protein